MIHVHFRKTSSFLFSFILSGLVPAYASEVERAGSHTQDTVSDHSQELDCAKALLELDQLRLREGLSASLGADNVGSAFKPFRRTSSLLVDSVDANNRGSHSEPAKRPRLEEESGQNDSHKKPRLSGESNEDLTSAQVSLSGTRSQVSGGSKVSDDSIHAKVKAARDFFNEADYPNAVKLWEEIFAEDSEKMKSSDYSWAITACDQAQDYDRGLKLCEMRIQHLNEKSNHDYDSKYDYYHSNYAYMGLFSFWKKDYRKAIEYYEEALKYLEREAPSHGVISGARYNRKIAEVYFILGEFDAAAKRWEKILSRYSRLTHGDYLKAADARFEVYKKTKKEEDLRRAIELFDQGCAKTKTHNPRKIIATYCKNKKDIEKAKKNMMKSASAGEGSAPAEERE